jgi:malate dehydrogenase (quinone)
MNDLKETSSVVDQRVDVLLVGAGIMSATLATMLKELQPDFKLLLLESLPGPAEESSNAWNNAGTGHAALCELNYTTRKPDGTTDISRALKVNTQFDLSRQLWSYLVRNGKLGAPETFIHSVSHDSFVHGADSVAMLRSRYQAMSAHHCFAGMEYSEDPAVLEEWMPLVMEGRRGTEPVAATQMKTGTDVDFGALTRSLIGGLTKQPGFSVLYSHRVTDIKRVPNGDWTVTYKNTMTGESRTIATAFAFLGAGGGALPLLQASGVEEGKGFGGFPVGGMWLRCDNPEIVERHTAKVYGTASVGTPPMSVPHLDARVIDGKKSLLFGPYAGFSTKFLKNGSLADLFLSIKKNNIVPLLAVGRDNIDLVKYLVQQVLLTPDKRFEALREYFPNAKPEDWRLQIAGQRVQVIMPDKAKGGTLQFGTELITDADGSLAAILGASPGASTAAQIMINVIEKCFKKQLAGPWLAKLKEMIPSYGQSIADDAELCKRVRSETAATLHILDVA